MSISWMLNCHVRFAGSQVLGKWSPSLRLDAHRVQLEQRRRGLEAITVLLFFGLRGECCCKLTNLWAASPRPGAANNDRCNPVLTRHLVSPDPLG